MCLMILGFRFVERNDGSSKVWKRLNLSVKALFSIIS